jgi:D-aminoacyl-tRNA deacylase
MRVVVQRVTRAEVRVGERVTGRISRGYVLLAAFRGDDDAATLTWMADKVVSLRLFPDDPAAEDATSSSFSRSLPDIDGSVLIVSQFTLYGDARKGRRPSFTDAAPPAAAIRLYDAFVALMEERLPGRVATGEFGAQMHVELVNDGPVTLILDRDAS